MSTTITLTPKSATRLTAPTARGATLALALVAGLLTACGGGGDDDDNNTPTPTSPPAITTQPAAQSVITDSTATFSVTATGPTLAYQWRKNGANIAGATAAAYTTPAVTYVDQGAAYTVVVSNADGSVTSSAAVLSLMASADQQVSIDLNASGGSYQIVWNLNYSGPQISGTNFASYDSSVSTMPTLTSGPQVVTQTPRVNLAAALPIQLAGPTRVLKNGVILVVPSHDQSLRTSYVGSSIRVDSLAADGVTVAFSQLRSNYSAVALAGDVKTTTPLDMAHYLNSFFSNPAVLNGGVNYPAGAGYIKYSSVFLGDRYGVFDCAAATVDANVTPCFTGTTLAAALAGGITSASDGVTYTTADGAFSTVGGVQVWVATAPRPQSATLSSAVQHRTYIALNGNVYTAVLTRDGQPFGGSYYVQTPGIGVAGLVFLPFNIRLNQKATQGLAAAMAI